MITGYTIQWGPKPELGKPFLPEDTRPFDAGETQVTFLKQFMVKLTNSVSNLAQLNSL